LNRVQAKKKFAVVKVRSPQRTGSAGQLASRSSSSGLYLQITREHLESGFGFAPIGMVPVYGCLPGRNSETTLLLPPRLTGKAQAAV
jgi:hypothetical protein